MSALIDIILTGLNICHDNINMSVVRILTIPNYMYSNPKLLCYTKNLREFKHKYRSHLLQMGVLVGLFELYKI